MTRFSAWKPAVAAATLTALAACSAQNNTVTPGIAAIQSATVTPAGLLDGESFSSTTATSTCHTKKSGAVLGNFTASGTASGPFPGYFIQSGDIEWHHGYIFRSQFSLQSGSKYFAGHELYKWSGGVLATCSGGVLSFGFNNRIKYHVHHIHTGGLATPALDASTFTESFYKQ